MIEGRTSRGPRIRLWVKLAIFGALGVVVTHAAHLSLANLLTSRALEHSQELLGRNVARLVANQAADAVLLEDRLSLQALMRGTVAGQDVEYALVMRDGKVIASSFPGPPPRSLVEAREPGENRPVVVVDGQTRYLDLLEPILDGDAGLVRVGVGLGIVDATRRQVSVLLGVLAVGVILAGVFAAFAVGRSVAGPVGELVSAAEAFDPSGAEQRIRPRTSDEIGELTECFNRMMARLKVAHQEQVRARAKERDTEKMAALGALVAGVAHEVNNPLAGMKNALRRLQREEVAEGSRWGDYLELLEEGLERIEDAMRQLLDYARPRPLHLEPFEALDVVRDGAGLLRASLSRRRIRLRVEEAGAGRVVADRRQVGQALLNLLLNAAYFTPDGGEIRVRFRRRGPQCGVSVEDDGPGVPVALRERILDPFFSTKPEGEGTGLGLSVTRSIIEAHGGELTLEYPERGTVATLWLPGCEEAKAEGTREMARAG